MGPVPELISGFWMEIRTVLRFAGIMLLLFFCSNVHALERFDIVTTSDLRQLLDARIQGEENFILVNTLDALIANHHSIPGSVNIPWSQIREKKDLLGSDKDRLIITYCMGYR